MPNRVTAMIGRQEAELKRRLDANIITREQVDDAHSQMDMKLDEYVSFQNLKSLASTDGTLTLEEAGTVYGFLGETVETFNGQPLAVKIVLTKLYQELLGKSLRRRGIAIPA